MVIRWKLLWYMARLWTYITNRHNHNSWEKFWDSVKNHEIYPLERFAVYGNCYNIMYAHNYINCVCKWENTNCTLNVCMCAGGWSYYGFHNLSWASSAKDAIKFWWGWWAIPMVSFSLTCWNKNSTIKKGLIMKTAQRQRCSHSSSIEHLDHRQGEYWNLIGY